MRHDETFKSLVDLVPVETIAAFLPEVIARFGPPRHIDLEPSEILPVLPGVDRGRFFDVALRATWPDGQQRVILLTEHWSRGREASLERAALYTTALMHRHPGIPVVPVLIIADHHAPADHLRTDLDGEALFYLRFRLLVLPRDLDARWQATHNPVLAILAALLRDLPPGECAYRALIRLKNCGASPALLMAALPFIENFASLSGENIVVFYRLLHQDPTMTSVLDLFKADGLAEGEAKGKAAGKAEGEAKGKAEGEAKGLVTAILDLVGSGDLAKSRAMIRLQHLADQRKISQDQLCAARQVLEKSPV